MTPKSALSPVLLSLFVGGCAARAGVPAAAVDPSAPSLTAAEADSPGELRQFPVRALEGRFTAQVDATEAPRVETKLDDGGAAQSFVNIPVGDREPIACLVSADQRDLGALVVRSTIGL
jgi:hypothetical protein